MKPIVSIIIPAYNASKTIDRCLESLLNQTLKGIEIIVINDCSKDNTLEILKSYKDKIVLLDNKENLGPSGSRNRGLKKAQGKYIGFVDADDYVELDAYENLTNEMKDDIDLVCGCRCEFDGDKRKPVINENETTNPRDFSKTSNYVTDKLYKKEIIDKYDLEFPKKYSYGEDFNFLFKYKFYAKKMKIIKKIVYNYNATSEGSITNSYDERVLDILKVVEDSINFLKEKDAFKENEQEMVEICAGFYVRRVREFKKYNNYKLKKQYVSEFLKLFKNTFKHYVHQVNGFKTKYYRFYRCSYPMMIIYIFISEIRAKIAKRG
jgi:glycosyltransferase involved in cell wall biosynthesis